MNNRAKIDLTLLPTARLESMAAASQRIEECYRVLQRAGLNIVGEVLKGQGEFVEMEHYPKDDVFDDGSHSQYYYHAHRDDSEHGHFHTFLRQPGIPSGIEPVPNMGAEQWPQGEDRLSHLVAISMDAYGFPVGLFTTNRWVTGDCWYRAEDVIAMLDGFAIDHAFPSWPVNIWMTAMLALFRPQIELLLHERDRRIDSWRANDQASDVFEDRSLEVVSRVPIDVVRQTKGVRRALASKQGRSSAPIP